MVSFLLSPVLLFLLSQLVIVLGFFGPSCVDRRQQRGEVRESGEGVTITTIHLLSSPKLSP